MAHSRLWHVLAGSYPSLLTVTNGIRILSSVLALSMVIMWAGSLWRCVTNRQQEGDAHRAGWVPLAGAVLMFEVRWFTPYLSDLARGRMLVVAHGGMALALLFAIYVHGGAFGGLRIRRAMIVHITMLTLCIGAAAILR